MKIKKIGHCCFVIETKGLRIMTDPGSWSSEQENEENIEMILITHEHGDHLHIESLKKVLAKNPKAHIYTNSSVAKILDEEQIKNCSVLEHGQNAEHAGIALEGHGKEHAEIYKDFGLVENTGYIVDHRLYFPGDAFHNPEKEIDVLALPVSAPWMSLKEAIDFAKTLKPKYAFPVHDGYLRFFEGIHESCSDLLSEAKIEFISLTAGSEHDFDEN